MRTLLLGECLRRDAAGIKIEPSEDDLSAEPADCRDFVRISNFGYKNSCGRIEGAGRVSDRLTMVAR